MLKPCEFSLQSTSKIDNFQGGKVQKLAKEIARVWCKNDPLKSCEFSLQSVSKIDNFLGGKVQKVAMYFWWIEG